VNPIIRASVRSSNVALRAAKPSAEIQSGAVVQVAHQIDVDVQVLPSAPSKLLGGSRKKPRGPRKKLDRLRKKLDSPSKGPQRPSS
jgi:hypothetical protein